MERLSVDVKMLNVTSRTKTLRKLLNKAEDMQEALIT